MQQWHNNAFGTNFRNFPSVGSSLVRSKAEYLHWLRRANWSWATEQPGKWVEPPHAGSNYRLVLVQIPKDCWIDNLGFIKTAEAQEKALRRHQRRFSRGQHVVASSHPEIKDSAFKAVYKPTRGLRLAAFFQETYSEMELSSDPDATKEPFCDMSTLEDRHQNDQTVPSAHFSCPSFTWMKAPFFVFVVLPCHETIKAQNGSSLYEGWLNTRTPPRFLSSLAPWQWSKFATNCHHCLAGQGRMVISKKLDIPTSQKVHMSGMINLPIGPLLA